MAVSLDMEEYDGHVEQMRVREYPMLRGSLCLDHAGTTLCSRKLMDQVHSLTMANLYGNPHSASPSGQNSAQAIESTRLHVLRFFGADPDTFDVVFNANATAAIRLVAEAFHEQDQGFWYGYHVDSHTSLVGVRAAATQHQCFGSDAEVARWLQRQAAEDSILRLFAYPAQSNMNGRKLPLTWLKAASDRRCYTLLDAAAYAPTSRLDLEDMGSAPDFTVVSFTKLFGFPDLGALIVKKSCAPLFGRRRYFGGGTVELVTCVKEQWHVMKSSSIHERVEDGTLPVHSILALGAAMKIHLELFRSFDHIAQHTARLARHLHGRLTTLKHANGRHVCQIYTHGQSSYADARTQGPSMALNLIDSRGHWVSTGEVGKLANVRDIHLRTGGLCNPGGIATALDLSPWQLRENFSAGHRCGSENDVMNGKPTGMIRVSLGAMSTMSDVDKFVDFVHHFFADPATTPSAAVPSPIALGDTHASRFYVESLTVYPIKSCAGWQVPHGEPWEVRREGLAWDREWCVVKQGGGTVLSQKTYPRMALIRPELDFETGVLRIRLTGSARTVTVPLSQDPTPFDATLPRPWHASIGGDPVEARRYTSPAIAAFFTLAVGVPCDLARLPVSAAARHGKPHLLPPRCHGSPRPILLSNESPILTISRSSLNRVNEAIKSAGGKAAHPAVFRANILLAESPALPPGREHAWAEDGWDGMSVGGGGGEGAAVDLEFWGGCRRCQMVCVDPASGETDPEPFSTLARTRRFAGRGVLFGVHACLDGAEGRRIRSGVGVRGWNRTRVEEDA